MIRQRLRLPSERVKRDRQLEAGFSGSAILADYTLKRSVSGEKPDEWNILHSFIQSVSQTVYTFSGLRRGEMRIAYLFKHIEEMKDRFEKPARINEEKSSVATPATDVVLITTPLFLLIR